MYYALKPPSTSAPNTGSICASLGLREPDAELLHMRIALIGLDAHARVQVEPNHLGHGPM